MSQYIIHSVLKHSLPAGTRIEDVRRNYVYTKSEMEYSTGRYVNGGTSVVVYFKPTEKPLDKTQTPDPYYAKIPVNSIPLRGNRPAYIKQQLKKWFSDFLITISDSELNKATYGALEAATPAINERLSTVDSKPQHPGYYSPNLKHTAEDADVIDCTSDHIEHAYSASNSFVGNSNVNGPNSKVLRMSFDKSGSSLYDNKNGLYATLHFELNGGYGTNPNGTNAFGISVDYDPRYYNDLKHYERKVREQLSNKLLQNASTNEWTVSPLEITKAAQFTVDAFKRYRLSKAHSQHPGYYSPNLKHSESDYLSVKMSDIN